MREDNDNLHLWHSPETDLLHMVMDRAIPVQLVFAPRGQTSILRMEGRLLHLEANAIRFGGVTDPALVTELDEILQEDVLRMPLACQVIFRIEYGQLKDDAIMPGEYAAMGEIMVLERDGDNQPVFTLHVSHRFTRRKTRRFERATWNPVSESLVRLLVVSGAPATREELGPLLFEAMHEKDKSHDLMDISRGGALIRVETQMAVRPLRMNAFYLMLLLPDRNDRAMLPHVFLARKVGVVQDAQDCNQSCLRLQFVHELEWQTSTRDNIVWQDIREQGSPNLGFMLGE